MADKEIIIDCVDVCKYKFQNAEKFNGKAYCTCLNKLCEDIAFCCENNCQVYEDFKQLQLKEQEIDTLKTQLLAAQTMEFEENAKLKAEIKSAKEMLIQNDCRTNSNTLPQIIEEFMSDNLLDAQDDEEYTIPVFKQVENKLETLEDLEQECKALEKRVKAEIHLGNKYKKDFAEQVVIAQKLEQALDEIEKICQMKEENSQFVLPSVWQQILEIINKAKGE